MKIIYITFIGRPGDSRDTKAHEIVDKYGGDVASSGTSLFINQRDLEAELPDDAVDACIGELRGYGFTVQEDD